MASPETVFVAGHRGMVGSALVRLKKNPVNRLRSLNIRIGEIDCCNSVFYSDRGKTNGITFES